MNLGEYTTIIRKFKQLVSDDMPLTVYDGTRSRDFTHIDDTIEALSLILNKNIEEPIYNIGTGVSYTIQEIADAFDHPIEYYPDKRKYELHTTLCSPNIPGWKSKVNVIEHIKQWKKDYADSKR
jgi:nucleoside-diphosphate-sugar epimerase